MSQTNQIVFQANSSPKPAKPERKGRGKTNSGSNAVRKPPNIPRYRAICVDVYQLKYMTSKHLEWHHRTVKAEHRLRATNRTLWRMVELGLLRRIELPTYRSLREGPAPYLYTLDRLGAHLVTQELGIPFAAIDYRPRPSEQNLWFMEHTLSIVSYLLTLRQACAQRQYEVSWIGESELRRNPERVKLANGERVSFIPDSYYVLAKAGAKSHLFLEMDRGTSTIHAYSPLQRRDWTRRMAGYEESLQSGLFTQRYGFRAMRVTVVTSSHARLNNLLAATEAAVPGHRDHFWLTTVEQITPETVLTAPIWAVAGREDRRYSLV